MSKKTDKKGKQHSKKTIIGNTNREGEGSMYDKIMRENLLELFLPLVAEELNFQVKSVKPLPDKQPTTILRETDAFLMIETYSTTEPKFILHLEFESKDNEEMVYRMMEYHGIELRKFRLPIKHVVVYLGEGRPKMRTSLKKTEVFEGFILVNAHSFSPQKWLSETAPSRIIMAILGDYDKKDADRILTAIFNKLKKVCKTDGELKKFVKQLIIISRMRNLEELTIKTSQRMSISIEIEKDYLYKLGLKKNEEILRKAQATALKAKELAKKATKEKAELKARTRALRAKVQAEKAKLEAKARAEKATLKAKAEAEKAKLEKAQAEKAELEAKAEAEKAKLEAKARLEKKISIQKLKTKNKFSDAEIMEILSLDKKTYKQYIKEISEEQKK
jgi:hypothetical protein